MGYKLQTMDAETLLSTPMEPIRFIVEGLLSQGLHILAGAPKIGKSWLYLWMCLQITKGETIWELKTEKKEVLCLCLEDSFSRIQARLFELTDEAPPTLHFAVMSQKIGEGLELQIETFLAEHQDTGLIVIDTLQKVRGNANATNSYAADYQQVDVLKKLADKHGISILLIHHLRKMHDSDPLNMISGTSGISGCADGNFVLQKDERIENTATLLCTGRDIEQREFHLEFNRLNFLWELLDPVIIDLKPVDETILLLSDFMKSKFSFTGTATELALELKLFADTEVSPSVLKKKIIQHMAELSRLGIAYTERRTFERREFTLIYDSNDGMTAEKPSQNLVSLPSVVSEPKPKSVDFDPNTAVGIVPHPP